MAALEAIFIPATHLRSKELSFSKTDLSAIPADDNTRECFVYGVGYGSSTFGTVAEQVAYREWTAEMQIIADAIEQELLHKFSADPNVDVNVHLNELEVISFYDWKKITFHRDQSYTAEGKKFEATIVKRYHLHSCKLKMGIDTWLTRENPFLLARKPIFS
eukprot:scaffold10966_cov80-Skeletonema_menzelii.AAC.2